MAKQESVKASGETNDASVDVAKAAEIASVANFVMRPRRASPRIGR